MRNATRQLANRLHLLGVAQTILDSSLLGYVLRCSAISLELACLFEYRNTIGVQQTFVAICTDMSPLEIVDRQLLARRIYELRPLSIWKSVMIDFRD